MESMNNKRFFPCPYCKGKAGSGDTSWAYYGGEPYEPCGACDGSGDGRVYVKKRDALKNHAK